MSWIDCKLGLLPMKVFVMIMLLPRIYISLNLVEATSNICYPELSLCNDTMINALEYNNNLTDITYESDVTITCPASSRVLITGITMELLFNSTGCLQSSQNGSCILQEHQIRDMAWVDYVKQSMCPVTDNCQSQISYKVPDRTIVKQFCGDVGNQTMIRPVIRLNYRCYKHCGNSNQNEPYYSFWHTLDKNCSSDVTTLRIFTIHLLLSHPELVTIMINLVTGAPANNLNDQLKAVAISKPTGHCLIEFDTDTRIVLGNTFFISTVVVAFPPNGKEMRPCEQRLKIQSDTNVYVICSGNTTFNHEVITGNTPRKYWVWFENDDTEVKFAFYLLMEVFKGKATVTCGYKSCNATTTSEETVSTGTTITQLQAKPFNITIITAACVSAFVVIVVAILVTIIIIKLRRQRASGTTNDHYDRRPEENGVKKSDYDQELYAELDDTQISKDGQEDGNNHYNEITAEDNLKEVYLTPLDTDKTNRELPNRNRKQSINEDYLNPMVTCINDRKLTNIASKPLKDNEKPDRDNIKEVYLTMVDTDKTNGELLNRNSKQSINELNLTQLDTHLNDGELTNIKSKPLMDNNISTTDNLKEVYLTPLDTNKTREELLNKDCKPLTDEVDLTPLDKGLTNEIYIYPLDIKDDNINDDSDNDGYLNHLQVASNEVNPSGTEHENCNERTLSFCDVDTVNGDNHEGYLNFVEIEGNEKNSSGRYHEICNKSLSNPNVVANTDNNTHQSTPNKSFNHSDTIEHAEIDSFTDSSTAEYIGLSCSSKNEHQSSSDNKGKDFEDSQSISSNCPNICNTSEDSNKNQSDIDVNKPDEINNQNTDRQSSMGDTAIDYSNISDQ